MRTAILGARGQLGRELCAVLPRDVVPLGRPEADLTRPAELAEVLRGLRPDVVINCAAYNFVDRAEDEPAVAFAVNADGVRDLARTCAGIGATLVQVSTDYVFGGDVSRTEPYSETDAPAPVSVYGESKLAGEKWVRAECPQHFVVRTCGLYGHHGVGGKGGNFVETIRRKAREGAPLRVVNDQRCTPTAATDLAMAIKRLLTTQAHGLHHVTNSGSCTWFEFARAILDLSGLRTSLEPTTSAGFGAKARRPAYSVLDCSKFAARCPPGMRPWREALADYLAQRPG